MSELKKLKARYKRLEDAANAARRLLIRQREEHSRILTPIKDNANCKGPIELALEKAIYGDEPKAVK